MIAFWMCRTGGDKTPRTVPIWHKCFLSVSAHIWDKHKYINQYSVFQPKWAKFHKGFVWENTCVHPKGMHKPSQFSEAHAHAWDIVHDTQSQVTKSSEVGCRWIRTPRSKNAIRNKCIASSITSSNKCIATRSKKLCRRLDADGSGHQGYWASTVARSTY